MINLKENYVDFVASSTNEKLEYLLEYLFRICSYSETSDTICLFYTWFEDFVECAYCDGDLPVGYTSLKDNIKICIDLANRISCITGCTCVPGGDSFKIVYK